jgi:hypothetical protein
MHSSMSSLPFVRRLHAGEYWVYRVSTYIYFHSQTTHTPLPHKPCSGMHEVIDVTKKLIVWWNDKNMVPADVIHLLQVAMGDRLPSSISIPPPTPSTPSMKVPTMTPRALTSLAEVIKADPQINRLIELYEGISSKRGETIDSPRYLFPFYL